MIANHALYFADLAAGGGVLPDHDAVVFDEAHRLEETAATWLGGRVSRAGSAAARRRRRAWLPRGVGAAPGPSARPDRAGGRTAPPWRRAARRPPPPARAAGGGRARAGRRAGDARGRAARPGRGARPARAAHARRRGPARGLPRRRRARARRLGRARCARLGAGRRRRRAARAPLDGRADRDPRLGDADGRRGRGASSAAGSGSITPASSWSARRSTTASRRCSTCRARCPIRAATGSPSAPPRRSLALLSLSRGRALVLTSSYRALEVLRARISGRVPYEVLVQGDAPRERLLERFRTEIDSVLLATSTFWQGVDMPRRVALAARDRQAAVLGARRPAARGPLRGGRRRRAATGSATSRCRPRCCSCARASGG